MPTGFQECHDAAAGVRRKLGHKAGSAFLQALLISKRVFSVGFRMGRTDEQESTPNKRQGCRATPILVLIQRLAIFHLIEPCPMNTYH